MKTMIVDDKALHSDTWLLIFAIAAIAESPSGAKDFCKIFRLFSD